MSQILHEPSRAAPSRRKTTAANGSAESVPALDRLLAEAPSLEDRIHAIDRAIRGRIVFATSLGLEDQAVLRAIAATGALIDVVMLDTGRHFPETLETLSASELRYGLKIRIVAPDARELEALVARDGVLGFRTSIERRLACCEVRKVRPLAKALTGASAWITGLRRGQSQRRADVPFAVWDGAHNMPKLAPLADWTAEKLDAYLRKHDVPVNPLHARGFPSIGCQPCTRAIRPGEDIRAGRWWWEQEDGKECGLHKGPNGKAAATAGEAA